MGKLDTSFSRVVNSIPISLGEDIQYSFHWVEKFDTDFSMKGNSIPILVGGEI